MPEPVASDASTANSPRLSASDASAPDAVTQARAKNQNPSAGSWYHGFGAASAPAATRMLRIPYASQKAPHVPCIAVATASRARYAHMPARNCASPPNIAANGASASPDWGVPHHPARFDATMKVAPAKPARPRIDGAAIGCNITRVAKPFVESCTPAEAMTRRSSRVLIETSLQRITMWFSPRG